MSRVWVMTQSTMYVSVSTSHSTNAEDRGEDVRDAEATATGRRRPGEAREAGQEVGDQRDRRASRRRHRVGLTASPMLVVRSNQAGGR